MKKKAQKATLVIPNNIQKKEDMVRNIKSTQAKIEIIGSSYSQNQLNLCIDSGALNNTVMH